MALDPLAASEPSAQDLYQALCRAVAKLGGFTEERKKTSIHLVRKSAFAGIAPRKKHLVLTIKAARPLESPRVFKSEQTSKSRWHHEVRLAAPSDIDKELLGWLAEAYALSE